MWALHLNLNNHYHLDVNVKIYIKINKVSLCSQPWKVENVQFGNPAKNLVNEFLCLLNLKKNNCCFFIKVTLTVDDQYKERWTSPTTVNMLASAQVRNSMIIPLAWTIFLSSETVLWPGYVQDQDKDQSKIFLVERKTYFCFYLQVEILPLCIIEWPLTESHFE